MSAQEIAILVSVALGWAGVQTGGIGLLMRWLLDRYRDHIDHRFSMLEQGQQREAEKRQAASHGVHDLRRELYRDFVRREDWIRFSGVIDAKLDALHGQLAALKEDINGGKRDGGESGAGKT